MGKSGIKEAALAAVCVALGTASLFGQLLVRNQPPKVRVSALSTHTPLLFSETIDLSASQPTPAHCVDLDDCLKTATFQTIAPGPSARLDLSKIANALVQIESAGDPDRVGLHGERGLMQIKSPTWQSVTRRLYGHPIDFNRAFEKELNLKVGTAYLDELCTFLASHREQWKADERQLLLACYNCGPTRVLSAGFDLSALPFQTQDYIARATALADSE